MTTITVTCNEGKIIVITKGIVYSSDLFKARKFLALGVKGIHIGPSLPVSVTPAASPVPAAKIEIKPIVTVEEDMKAILG